MTYPKKVIRFKSEAYWSFWDFQYAKDSNPIEDWYGQLSEEAARRLDALLKVNSKTDSPHQWVGFKRFLQGGLKQHRIWELEFHADKRQYRLLGKFGDVRKQAILLMGCYHKGRVYTPADALEQASKRAKLLAEGKAIICERPINEDF